MSGRCSTNCSYAPIGCRSRPQAERKYAYAMSQVTVTLPDGSTRRSTSGTPVLAVAAASRRAWPTPRSPRRSTTARRPHLSADRGRARADRHEQEPGGARALSPLDGAPDGRRGDGALPERAVRHRSAHRRGLLLRLRRRAAVRARGSRAHRSEDARAGVAGSASTSARCGRARRRSTSSRSAASRSRCS